MSLAMQGIFVAASGGVVQEQRLQITSNNLANANTVGFKKDRPAFKEYLPPWGGDASPGARVGMRIPIAFTSEVFKDDRAYVITDEVKTDFSQGNGRFTGNPLDVALEGKGFFVLKSPEGLRYTRAGNFSISAERVLVNKDGLFVLGENGPIKIEGKEIVVGEDGGVYVDNNRVDTLRVVDFDNLKLLKKEGDNLFINEDEERNPEKKADVVVKQGSLELSNINVVKEMIGMIELLRSYQALQRVINSQDEMNGKAISNLPRVG